MEWPLGGINLSALTSDDLERLITDLNAQEASRLSRSNDAPLLTRYQLLREKVLKRDGYRCQQCGEWRYLQVDHIFPKARGGRDNLENLQTLCRLCNQRKGTRVPHWMREHLNTAAERKHRMSRTLGTVTNTVEGVAPPAGTYQVSLKSIEDADGDYGPQWKWVFNVEQVIHSNDDDAEEFVGEELHGYSSTGLGPKHKARGWVEALMRQRLDEGTSIAESDLVGKRAVATVIEYPKADGSTGTKIATEGGLQPYKKKPKKAKPDPEPEPEEEEDELEESGDEPF